MDGNFSSYGFVVEGELVRRRTKTQSSDAPLPLPDIRVEALRHRRRVENTLRLTAGGAWHPSGLLLTTRFGDAIDPRNFQRAFRSSVRRASVPVRLRAIASL